MKNIIIYLFSIVVIASSSCGGNDKNSQNQIDSSNSALLKTPSDGRPLKISFASLDGLIITADSYFQNDTLPWILLCHQAGFSRGEFKETAVKFKNLGFNCLAIDQRSGEEVNGIKNETAVRAKEQGKAQTYLDAEQDIIAAINYLHTNSKKQIVLLGSSYSAGLVLKIAVGNPNVKAVLSFSPGEYYGDKLDLAKSITKINVPVFITCAKSEIKDTRPIFDAIENKNKLFFSPTSPGVHASSSLWESTNDYKEYWKAVNTFFELLK